MNETDEYILNAIKTWVWTGFYSPDEVDAMIDDILERNADEAMLRAAVAPEFDKKAAAEASWPDTTDCDRLDRAFQELNSSGIIALHNAGYTTSDGLDHVSEALRERGKKGVKGYCFYHGQDVERAVAGGGLFVAFGDLGEDKTKKTEIGHLVKAVLQACELAVEWNGDPEMRLSMPGLAWKRRRVV
ncbi:MAG: DUF6891 domain-containing protein [Gemmataceae bacterium]